MSRSAINISVDDEKLDILKKWCINNYNLDIYKKKSSLFDEIMNLAIGAINDEEHIKKVIEAKEKRKEEVNRLFNPVI